MDKNLSRYKQLVGLFVIASLAGLSFVGCMFPSGEYTESTLSETTLLETTSVQTVSIGISSDDFMRMNYREAVDHLIERGFVNVVPVAIGDIMYDADYVVDSVSSVDIDGQSSFGASESFSIDSQVYVNYHSIADIEAGSPDLYLGEEYSDVVEALQTRGFTNIQLSEYPDLIFGYTHSEGEVSGIEINGQSDFTDDSIFPSGALVVVTYHTFADDSDDSIDDLEILTFEEYADYFDGVLQESYGDNHMIEIQEDNTLVVSTWSEGISELYTEAEAGDVDRFAEWNQFKLDVQLLCEDIIDQFEYVEVEEPHLVWNVLDETDTDVVLLTYSDNEFTYDAVPTPTPTNTPTPTPTNTPTPTPTPTSTPTPTPTPSPTPTPVPVTRYAFRRVYSPYTIYYIVDTETHTATRFTSDSPEYPIVETFSGDITSGQVACYEGGELMEYLEIRGRIMILTEYDGYEYQFNGCSLSATEALLE